MKDLFKVVIKFLNWGEDPPKEGVVTTKGETLDETLRKARNLSGDPPNETLETNIFVKERAGERGHRKYVYREIS